VCVGKERKVDRVKQLAREFRARIVELEREVREERRRAMGLLLAVVRTNPGRTAAELFGVDEGTMDQVYAAYQ